MAELGYQQENGSIVSRFAVKRRLRHCCWIEVASVLTWHFHAQEKHIEADVINGFDILIDDHLSRCVVQLMLQKLGGQSRFQC